jgi:hypothetical protein
MAVEHRDGRRYPHDADNEARIYEKDGQLWVTHEELLKCGYINLADFDVVFLNEKFYELQAHIRRPNAWWIEEIDAEKEAAAAESETSEVPPRKQA